MMSSLYVGASGLRGLSAGMQVVSNNLANQNTIGFKQSMMMYQDMLSQTVPAPSNNITGLSQRGHGLGIIGPRTLFTNGPLEPGNSTTDLAINGGGFFGVEKDGIKHYTRAGNFRFDKMGNLLDPNGFQLLGRPIKNGVTSSGSEGIKLDLTADSQVMTIPPRATTYINTRSSIGGVKAASTDSTNNFFAMTSNWNGLKSPPLDKEQYSYSEPMTVYDSEGNAHTLSIYYNYAGTKNGAKVYEYSVGIPPAEDGSANAGTKSAGLLMSGTLTFTSAGEIMGMTAFTPTGNDPSVLSNWVPAQLKNGVPAFNVQFAGGSSQSMSLDLGFTLENGWGGINSPTVGASNPDAFYLSTPGIKRTVDSINAYGTNTVSYTYSQDGYAKGELHDLYFTDDGIMTGKYSNGQSQELYQLNLYRFKSNDGLKHEGKNHFSATANSGVAEEGTPQVQNFGSVHGKFIEVANVDVAREMTQMIITQRGFQMNSKVVTTSDQMLQKALEIKR